MEFNFVVVRKWNNYVDTVYVTTYLSNNYFVHSLRRLFIMCLLIKLLGQLHCV